MSSRRLVVQPLGFEAPIAGAAQELGKYLPMLAEVTVEVLPTLPALPEGADADIVLSVSSRLADRKLGKLPPEHALDDALTIVPKGDTLYLVGANARSVLFAAYRLLEGLGCVFLRPGPDGEVIPRHQALRWPAKPIRETASYRHRGICIEGYPRLEHCLALLDWMAKKRMNTWHLEFPYASVYWERGYRQSQEMQAAGFGPISTEDARTLDDRTIARAKELGMVIHRAGHGWTAAALGYAGVDWNAAPDRPLDPAKRDWVAQVHGVRGFWRNEPTNTELCYSNPEAREGFYQAVLSYARERREVDVLHVWLSDATNNHCECETCAAQSVTDWYLLLINELSARFAAEGLPMRIVFLSYFDTLWPPERQPISDPRLIFMYAPISRCYRHALNDPRCGGEAVAGRPDLNRVVLPNRNRATAQIAQAWKSAGPADSFIFEYYRWMPTWFDGMGIDLADTAAEDMRDLEELGINGAISNDCIRAFYPLPVLPNAVAEGLWNRRFRKGAHREKLMAAAFGAHRAAVERYFAALVAAFAAGEGQEHFVIQQRYQWLPQANHAQVGRLAARAQRDLTARATRERNAVVRTSLELVALHAEQVARVMQIALAAQAGDRATLAAIREEHTRRLPEVLREYEWWVDVLVGRPVQGALWEAERMVAK